VFFPVLRTYANEVRAIRHLAQVLLAARSIVPVFEPVTSGQIANLTLIADAGLELLLIVNPDRGPYESSSLPHAYDALLSHPQVIPTLLVDAITTAASVATFRPGSSIAAYFQDLPSAQTQAAIASRRPRYGLFAAGLSPSGIVARAQAVEVADPFNRRRPNAMYLGFPEEFYSSRYATIGADANFAHFGDHSIQGDALSASGGQGANHVALHHIYVNGKSGSPLHIRHYVSTVHSNLRSQVSLKFLDALSALCNDLPQLASLNADNDSSTCDEYRSRNAEGYATNLGTAKGYGIRHHLELMSRLVP
jgi:hypothetical protein